MWISSYCDRHQAERPCGECSANDEYCRSREESSKYLIVSNDDVIELERMINRYLDTGAWQLVGGLQVAVYADSHKSTANFGIMSTNFSTNYLQTLTRVESE